jgi:hypothetical protein
MPTKVLLTIFCFLSLNLSYFSNSLFAEEKASPYSFLKNNLTARAAGLAGTSVSFENDAGGLFVNPALIFTHQGNNLNVTFLKHVLDINSGNISYIYQDENLGTFAGSVAYTNFGSFDYYNEFGDETGGSFSSNLLSFGGSYANKIAENLYGGASLKFIFNQLEKMSGFAVAVDAGLFYKFEDNRTNIGFSILNAGTELKKFGDEKAAIPVSVNLGFNHRLKGLPLNFNFNFNNLQHDYGDFFSRFSNISIGGELYIGEYVQLRLGYNNYIRRNLTTSQSKGLAGLAAGLGIVTNVVNVDYGINIYTSDLFLHRFGVNFKL